MCSSVRYGLDKRRINTQRINNLYGSDTFFWLLLRYQTSKSLQELGHSHRCPPDSSKCNERHKMNKFKHVINPLKWSSVLLLSAVIAGCGSGGSSGSAPIAGAATGVNLGTASDFVMLAKTGITNVPTSDITGDIGASPVTGAAIDVTCGEITGTIYGSNAAYTGSGNVSCYKGTAPDNTVVANAVLDMGTAYTKTAGRVSPDFTELYAGDLSAKTLVPGLYKWGTGVVINAGGVTLSGSASDIWIFQIAGDLTQAANVSVTLAGGAVAKNIFWQVGGSAGATLGAGAHFEGTILAAKAIDLGSLATVNGRLFADSAVNLIANTVSLPAP